MPTTPQDENKSKQLSPQSQLPEACCTADDFYREYLNEEWDVNVGPFTYPVKRNNAALAWDFPTGEFLDALSTDAKNTLRFLLHMSRVAEYRRAYVPQHVSTITDRHMPDVRVQFAAKMAAMKNLLEVTAQATRQLDEKVEQWMAAEKTLRSNVEALEKLMQKMDLLSDDATNAERV
jgi:hypothetical protein